MRIFMLTVLGWPRMYVPEHITATGDELRYGEQPDKRNSARLSLIEKMEVPDRITVVGGDMFGRIDEAYNQGVQIPTQVNTGMKDIPDILTMADTAYSEEEIRRHVDTARTDNSIVVDEDPLRELKMLRRQMGRINARVYELEEQNEKRRSRESMFILAILGIAITAVWSIFKH
ncbi:unnamed protein product [Caenorhabditis bovis]|uniref:Mitochondrial fission factor n=1 Tax=Caenorhabditis bovis TaxID=2654633 RepID=A0A8S1F3Y2_9PELO|nr:unnamed protein product [Caenorhabditis bovis]